MKTENVYEQILKESLNYQGTMFWENYMLSNLVKTFANDYADLQEKAIGLYTTVYGKEIKPLLEMMVENEDNLYEAATIKGLLLFEEVGTKNVLNEMDAGAASYFFNRSKSAISPQELARFKKFPTGTAITAAEVARMKKFPAVIGNKTGGVLGFLRGLWTKLKELGAAVFRRVLPFVRKGFAWAKNIAQKGVSWIASNPIARVAVPAVLIAGGTLAAIKMINKLRKKKGKSPLNDQEKEQFTSLVDKNKNKIQNYANEAGVKVKFAA